MMEHISQPVLRVMERIIATARGEMPPVEERRRRSPHWFVDEYGEGDIPFRPRSPAKRSDR